MFTCYLDLNKLLRQPFHEKLRHHIPPPMTSFDNRVQTKLWLIFDEKQTQDICSYVHIFLKWHVISQMYINILFEYNINFHNLKQLAKFGHNVFKCERVNMERWRYRTVQREEVTVLTQIWITMNDGMSTFWRDMYWDEKLKLP